MLCSLCVSQFHAVRSKSGLQLWQQLRRQSVCWVRMIKSYNSSVLFAVCILAHWQASSLQDAGLQEDLLLPMGDLCSARVAEKVVFH